MFPLARKRIYRERDREFNNVSSLGRVVGGGEEEATPGRTMFIAQHSYNKRNKQKFENETWNLKRAYKYRRDLARKER